MPLITDDTGFPIFNLFNTESLLPSTVFIDHTMTVYYQEAGWSSSSATTKVNQMLNNLENTLIIATDLSFNIDSQIGDNDGLLNPGEAFDLNFTLSNNSFYLPAGGVVGYLEGDDDIIFSQNSLSFGDMEVDESSFASMSGYVNDNVSLGDHNFILNIVSNDGESEISYPFTINITLNQSGYPFDTNSEVRPSPAVVDFLDTGNNNIIFGDNNGVIHLLDVDGNEIENETFPFDTGGQIWGAQAIGDIDHDGVLDMVVTSNSKHMYVLNEFGLILDYYANQFLIGTPALGNLDDDEDLEIVFGGYSNPGKLFAVNIDGSDVPGFPIVLDEKMQKGVALYDMNGNDKDDIIVGTDDDNVYLVYDNAQIANGFPFTTGDKVRSAPVVIDTGNDKVIIVGSKDEHLYAINDDGSLRFSFESDDDIYTSPSFLETEAGVNIFFGSDDGTLYALDLYGNIKDGFPISDFGPIVGSILFSDLDNDNSPEIIFGDESGSLNILKSINSDFSEFSNYNNTPISNDFSYSSSANVQDIDSDGDLEVFAGTAGDVVVYDIKESSSVGDYWNIYRGTYHRTGSYVSISGGEIECMAGDLNSDTVINILDIVTLVNIVVSGTGEFQMCAADLNSDNVINILDIVTLVNIVVNG